MFNKSRGGPKTAHGKKRSSQNARRHGLFADEFSFSPADEIAFAKLNAGLRKELKPDTALLDLIFQDLVACAWRIRIALRYEQQELRKQFAINNEEGPEEPQAVGVSFHCRLQARQIQQLIKLLDSLHDRIQEGGRVPPEFEEPFTQAFGAELWKTITKWAPQDPVSLWVGRLNTVARERDEIFGIESSIPKVSAQEKKEFAVANAFKELEATCKLINIFRNIFLSIHNSIESGDVDEQGGRLDLSIRYHTTTHRDFYRALREYHQAKNSS
jgi:hypothetical protein